MKKIWTLLLLAGLSLSLSAQGLVLYGLRADSTFVPGTVNTGDMELVSVDPLSGVITGLSVLPGTSAAGAATSTYDQGRGRYIFWGRDDNGDNRFYAVAVNGDTIIDPLIQNTSSNPPIELQYDLQDDTTIALWWDNQAQLEYLVSLDLQSGNFSQIGVLTGVEAIALGSSGYNSNHHRYIFKGVDDAFNFKLYYADAQTGQILYEPILTDTVLTNFFQYDLNSDQLYTLYTQTDSSQVSGSFYYRNVYLGTVDTITAAIARVGNTPILEGYQTGIAIGSLDFDQMTQTMILVGRDESQPEFRIIGIDVTTGQTVFDNPLNPLQPQVAAVWDVECDNQVFARMAYGADDDSSTTAIFDANFNQGVTLGPVPASSTLRVAWPERLEGLTVEIYNVQGALVRSFQTAAGTSAELQIGDLPSGIYSLMGRTPAKVYFAKKWMKQ